MPEGVEWRRDDDGHLWQSNARYFDLWTITPFELDYDRWKDFADN